MHNHIAFLTSNSNNNHRVLNKLQDHVIIDMDNKVINIFMLLLKSKFMHVCVIC